MYALVKCTLLKFWDADNIFPCLHEAIEFLHFKVRTFRFYLPSSKLIILPAECIVFSLLYFFCSVGFLDVYTDLNR